MNVVLYQISLDRDSNLVAFRNLEATQKTQGSTEIDAAIYERVFDGNMDYCDTLDELYEAFNVDCPDGYCGRSMSVSDVVEVRESDSVEPSFYFCDSVGFKKIDFDPSLAAELKTTITVVMVEPSKVAKIAEIGTSLEDLQAAVGGMIETYYPFEEEVCIVCNDEGKITGMPLNRAIYSEQDPDVMQEIIAGPFFICDCSTPQFRSLTPEQQSKYLEKFQYPERFFRAGSEIVAVPFAPEKNQER